jgi:hypothetical protein
MMFRRLVDLVDLDMSYVRAEAVKVRTVRVCLYECLCMCGGYNQIFPIASQIFYPSISSPYVFQFCTYTSAFLNLLEIAIIYFDHLINYYCPGFSVCDARSAHCHQIRPPLHT